MLLLAERARRVQRFDPEFEPFGSRRNTMGEKACGGSRELIRIGEAEGRDGGGNTNGDFNDILVTDHRVITFEIQAVNHSGDKDGTVHRVGCDDMSSFGRPSV